MPMPADPASALWPALAIALVGLALVFAIILLLWGLMALLVRLTAEPAPVAAAEALPLAAASAGEAAPAGEELDDPRGAARRRAAAAAVAVALLQIRRAPAAPAAPAAAISPWQSVMRGRQLKQRGRGG
jgi:hypothetical protein